MVKFKRTNYAFNIVRVQFFRRLRVYLRKFRKKRFTALFFGAYCKMFPVFGVCFGFGKTYIFNKRSHIKSRSACNNRYFAARKNIIDANLRTFKIILQSERFRRFDNAYQMMRYALHFFIGGFCRTDIHIFIYLHGIGGDDLSVVPLGYLDRKFGFSACGRTDNGNNTIVHQTILLNCFSMVVFDSANVIGRPCGQYFKSFSCSK